MGMPAVTRRTAILTGLAIPAAAIVVRWRGLGAARRWLGRSAGRALPPKASDGERVGEIVGGFKIGLRRAPYKGNCLSRSLALSWLLLRQGIACDLRIGVRTHEGSLQAHAWVEHHHQVLNDAPDVAAHYRPFAERFNLSWV